MPSRTPARAGRELAAVADAPESEPGDEPDRVRDVRRHRGVAEREQHGERDERPAADDGVDRPGGDPGREDRERLEDAQGAVRRRWGIAAERSAPDGAAARRRLPPDLHRTPPGDRSGLFQVLAPTLMA